MPGSNDGPRGHRKPGLCINPSLFVQPVLSKHLLHVSTVIGPEVTTGKGDSKDPTFLDLSVEGAKHKKSLRRKKVPIRNKQVGM